MQEPKEDFVLRSIAVLAFLLFCVVFGIDAFLDIISRIEDFRKIVSEVIKFINTNCGFEINRWRWPHKGLIWPSALVLLGCYFGMFLVDVILSGSRYCAAAVLLVASGVAQYAQNGLVMQGIKWALLASAILVLIPIDAIFIGMWGLIVSCVKKAGAESVSEESIMEASDESKGAKNESLNQSANVGAVNEAECGTTVDEKTTAEEETTEQAPVSLWPVIAALWPLLRSIFSALVAIIAAFWEFFEVVLNWVKRNWKSKDWHGKAAVIVFFWIAILVLWGLLFPAPPEG